MMAGGSKADSWEPGLVQRERVRALYRQMPITLGVTMLNVTLTVLVLEPEAEPVLLWWWAALIAFLTLVRLIGWQAYRTGPRLETGTWVKFSVAGSLVSGLLWGGGAALLFPGNQLHQLFLAFVVGGMCAGAVTVNSSYFPSLAAFVLPASVPLAARFFVETDRLHVAMGTMTLVFAVALLVIGRQFNTYFIEVFDLQLELDDTNESLRQEIVRHQVTEASLRQSQKLEAIGRLTGGIAHDFNNVLTGVIGFVSIAMRQLDKNGRPAQLLENALRAADRGAMLTQRLLAFARKQTLNPKPVDLAGLVMEMTRRHALDRDRAPARQRDDAARIAGRRICGRLRRG